MPIVRSYSNAFEVVDYSQELAIVPNQWTPLSDVGLFQDEFLTTHTTTFEETNMTLGLVGDQFRGAKPQANKDYVRKIHSYNIPHFPIVDEILPQDTQGKRAFGSTTAAESLDAVMARKLERIQKNFTMTKEVARFYTLTTGNVYAPNGTMSGNFFTDFGISQTVVNFDLSTPSTNVVAKCEAVIADIQDKAQTGDVITGVIGYASPEFFAALISHANVVAAYTYYTASEAQSILRNRAGGAGLYREFTYGGIRFIEIRQSFAGTRFVPIKDCIFVPVGTQDAFVTYYGPANKMDYVNTRAEAGYVWTFRDPKGEKIDIDAETNFINVLRRPQMVIRGYTP